jgi:hypothetical protein
VLIRSDSREVDPLGRVLGMAASWTSVAVILLLWLRMPKR